MAKAPGEALGSRVGSGYVPGPHPRRRGLVPSQLPTKSLVSRHPPFDSDLRITSNTSNMIHIHLLQEQQSTAQLSLNKSKILALFLQ